MLDAIKNWFYNRSLLKASNSKKRKKNMNLIRAKSIGILFDANDLANRKIILQYANQLKKIGKRVKLLGFIDIADKEAQFSFSFFSKKEINWANCPKGERVTAFLANSYDLFININPSPNLISDFIAAAANAEMKIGPVSTNNLAYDLMIDLNSKKGLPEFIKQFEMILQKTNVHAQTV